MTTSVASGARAGPGSEGLNWSRLLGISSWRHLELLEAIARTQEEVAPLNGPHGRSALEVDHHAANRVANRSGAGCVIAIALGPTMLV